MHTHTFFCPGTGSTPGWTRLPVQLILYDYTFSNLSHELTRTVRSSSKVSNPLFQSLIGSQTPTRTRMELAHFGRI